MINEPRSQYKEYMKRQETAGQIEEGTPVKTDGQGIHPVGILNDLIQAMLFLLRNVTRILSSTGRSLEQIFKIP